MRHEEIAGAVGVPRRVLELLPHRRSRVDIGAACQQRAHDRRMPLIDRPHERRLTTHVLGGIDVGAVIDQQRDGLDGAAPCGGHQGRLTRGERAVRIGAGIQQLASDDRIAVQAGEPQRRRPELVGTIDVGAGADQQLGRRQVRPVSRPMQRRRAIALRRIHVHAGSQQLADTIDRAAPDRLNQRST